MGFSTDAVHAGQTPDPVTGAVIPPLYLTSTYAQSGIGEHQGYEYARGDNRTRETYERNVAALEGAHHGIAFASGMAALDAVVCLLDAGQRCLVSDRAYGGTYRLLSRVRARHGIAFDRVPTHDLDAVRRALRPETRLLLVETPTNPTLELTDLAACAELCRAHGVILAVDNTFLSPYFQRPMEHGADLVVHSATKYLNGHSDVIGGIVLGSDGELAERLRFHQFAAGAVAAPFDCWLVMRGVKTLAVRMERHGTNARVLAEALREHPAPSRVLWPGFADHPQRDLARRQMAGAGAILALDLDTRGRADRFLRALRVFTLAESLGGVESLASYPAEMTHASLPEAERLRVGITPGLVRLSVGIEDADDLRDDVLGALDALGAPAG